MKGAERGEGEPSSWNQSVRGWDGAGEKIGRGPWERGRGEGEDFFL